MIDILTHYFRTGRPPFLSLSALAEEEALEIMNELYVDNEMWGRFRNPMAYLTERKKCEQWLKNAFISKGGIPKQNYPIYMVLGTCPEIEKKMKSDGINKIEIPVSFLNEEEVSFTFLDSMYTLALEENKPVEYYQSEYHGKVFTLSEINEILCIKGKTNKKWWGKIPKDFLPYIEAQVWNQEKLTDYFSSNRPLK